MDWLRELRERPMVTAQEAWKLYQLDARANYEAVKAQALADGMVEVEPGHFVKPGESWEDENGTIHRG